MQERIRGIVLRTVKYGDAGLVVDLFTERHGRMSFMTTVSHGRHKGGQQALWRLLGLVEFEADLHGNARVLPRPRYARPYIIYNTLPYHPVKATQAMFLAEVLSYVLRGEQADEPLFRYLEHSLQWLDGAAADFSNFHLVLLMRLTRFVGVFPNIERSDPSQPLYFDLMEGTYRAEPPLHAHFLLPDEASRLPLLLRMNYRTMRLFRFSRQQRQRMLEVLNDYYRLHVPSFPELRSLAVLREVFA